jgi:hypothetical protein
VGDLERTLGDYKQREVEHVKRGGEQAKWVPCSSPSLPFPSLRARLSLRKTCRDCAVRGSLADRVPPSRAGWLKTASSSATLRGLAKTALRAKWHASPPRKRRFRDPCVSLRLSGERRFAGSATRRPSSSGRRRTLRRASTSAPRSVRPSCRTRSATWRWPARRYCVDRPTRPCLPLRAGTLRQGLSQRGWRRAARGAEGEGGS